MPKSVKKDNDKLTQKIVNQYIKQPKKTNITVSRGPGTTKIYRPTRPTKKAR